MGCVRGANCGDYQEVSAQGVIEGHADTLAGHAVRMRNVIADRDEEPARTPVFAPAGEEQRLLCVDNSLGARRGMCFPAEEGAGEALRMKRGRECRCHVRDRDASGAQLVCEYLRTSGVIDAGIGNDGELSGKVRTWA